MHFESYLKHQLQLATILQATHKRIDLANGIGRALSTISCWYNGFRSPNDNDKSLVVLYFVNLHLNVYFKHVLKRNPTSPARYRMQRTLRQIHLDKIFYDECLEKAYHRNGLESILTYTQDINLHTR